MLLSGYPWQDWSDPTNPEQWVYHYTTRDAAIGSILPTGQIRLSLFEWMSDPRESKKWLFGGRGAGEHNLLELSDRTNELAKAHTKILCVSKDTEDVPVSPNERYQRGFAHSRMWTDYAGRHSGVCLIFDRTKLHEAIRNVVAPETVYADRMTYSEWRLS
jgi:hypothetical protein